MAVNYPQPTHQLNQYAEEYCKNILPTNLAPISSPRNGNNPQLITIDSDTFY